MDLEVLAPENPGAYRLEWDVVQEGIIWFTQLTGIRNTTTVAVGDGREPPPTAAGTAEQPAADPRIPPRTELWSAAFDLLSERPLLGIGLDTFRLSYGKLVDLPTWNRTVHSNSLYVETLVSLGILGSLAFFGWLLALGSDLARVLFRSPTVLRAALAAGLFAYLIHGFFDYFLLFSSTGLLFWILCGLWLAATRRSLA
jgi:O-antigen ligase